METKDYQAQVKTQGHEDTCSLEAMQRCQEEKDLDIWWLRVKLEYQIGKSSQYEDVLEVNFTEALKKLAKENPVNYRKLAAIVERHNEFDSNGELKGWES